MSRKPHESYPKMSSMKSVYRFLKESPMKDANDNSSKPLTSNLPLKVSKIFSRTSSTPRKSPKKKSKKSLIRLTINFDQH